MRVCLFVWARGVKKQTILGGSAAAAGSVLDAVVRPAATYVRRYFCTYEADVRVCAHVCLCACVCVCVYAEEVSETRSDGAREKERIRRRT